MAESILSFNPSPKARFVSVSEWVKAHRALLDRPEMQRAIDFATLEYHRSLCEQNTDANGAAASHFKARGAAEFLHVLRNLGEMPQRLTAAPDTNLDHRQ